MNFKLFLIVVVFVVISCEQNIPIINESAPFSTRPPCPTIEPEIRPTPAPFSTRPPCPTIKPEVREF